MSSIERIRVEDIAILKPRPIDRDAIESRMDLDVYRRVVDTEAQARKTVIGMLEGVR